MHKVVCQCAHVVIVENVICQCIHKVVSQCMQQALCHCIERVVCMHKLVCKCIHTLVCQCVHSSVSVRPGNDVCNDLCVGSSLWYCETYPHSPHGDLSEITGMEQ